MHGNEKRYRNISNKEVKTTIGDIHSTSSPLVNLIHLYSVSILDTAEVKVLSQFNLSSFKKERDKDHISINKIIHDSYPHQCSCTLLCYVSMEGKLILNSSKFSQLSVFKIHIFPEHACMLIRCCSNLNK